LNNDSDVDGDTLTVTSVAAPANGTADVRADSSILFTPAADWFGVDAFSYAIADGNGGTATATVTVTVTSVNDAPVAVADAADTDEDTAVVIPVLNNDNDVDGDTLTVTSVTAPVNGTALVQADGSIRYTPDDDWYGVDTFDYAISDGQGGTSAASVTVSVHPVNDAPVAADDAATTSEDAAVIIAVLANDSDVDGDDLVVASTSLPAGGIAVINADSSVTFSPDPNFNGVASFSYTVSDSHGALGNTATVSVTVTPVNDPPVAAADSYATNEDTALNVAVPGVLGNDEDIDGDALTALVIASPANGSVTLNADGSFSYLPNADFFGTDSFTYQVSDGIDPGNTVAVDLLINPVNDSPVVTVTPAAQVVQYSDAITPVTITASDIDSSVLSITQSGLPASTSVGAPSCTPSGIGTSCSWQAAGFVTEGQVERVITFSVSDGAAESTGTTLIRVAREDVSFTLADDNPVAVGVDLPGSDSSITFTISADVYEKSPEATTSGQTAAGDIGLAAVRMMLVPVGPGASVTPVGCAEMVAGSGYAGIKTVTCTFDDAPVNTYTVDVVTTDEYFVGAVEDVLTVFDPSLGFTTGGGWFYWPGSGEKTNFGYTMKYNKQGTKVQGSLLLIRHVGDGTKYRVKSNALYGLAIGDDQQVPLGWATFSGKSTYLEPEWVDAEGNHEFTVYVEDRDEPGTGTDRFWIQVRGKDGAVIPASSLFEPAPVNATAINGGNLVVPH
jgi:hypothetical protein